MNRFRECNPSFPYHNWKVGRLDEADVTFKLNVESNPRAYFRMDLTNSKMVDNVAEPTDTAMGNSDVDSVRDRHSKGLS